MWPKTINRLKTLQNAGGGASCPTIGTILEGFGDSRLRNRPDFKTRQSHFNFQTYLTLKPLARFQYLCYGFNWFQGLCSYWMSLCLYRSVTAPSRRQSTRRCCSVAKTRRYVTSPPTALDWTFIMTDRGPVSSQTDSIRGCQGLLICLSGQNTEMLGSGRPRP
jgi:hypothetical protein